MTHQNCTALTESQQVAQQQLNTAQEEHEAALANAREDFDARITTLVRLNDANTSIATHKFETAMEASEEKSAQQLARLAQQNDEHLLEVEKVRFPPL